MKQVRVKKTVRRYLESIQLIFGLELLVEKGPDRKFRYRIEKHATPFRPLVFNASEILSLYFIRGFAHFKDLDFIQSNLSQVFNKIKLSAKEAKERSGNNFLERVSSLFILPKELGGKQYIQESEINCLNKIILAALDHIVCDISYGSGKETTNYKLGPLHFFNYRDAIYLLSLNLTLSEQYSERVITTIAIHRIKDVKMLDQSYEYPHDLDLEKEFESGSFNFEDEIHKIRLKFPAQVRDYIMERDWYPNPNM